MQISAPTKALTVPADMFMHKLLINSYMHIFTSFVVAHEVVPIVPLWHNFRALGTLLLAQSARPKAEVLSSAFCNLPSAIGNWPLAIKYAASLLMP
jgi:hypothetical protein